MSYSKMNKAVRDYLRAYDYKGYVFYDGYNRPGSLSKKTLEGARAECIRNFVIDHDGLGIYKVTSKGITFCGNLFRDNGRYKYAAGNHWEPAGSHTVYLVDPKTGKLVSEAKIDRSWDGHRRAMKLRY